MQLFGHDVPLLTTHVFRDWSYSELTDHEDCNIMSESIKKLVCSTEWHTRRGKRDYKRNQSWKKWVIEAGLKIVILFVSLFHCSPPVFLHGYHEADSLCHMIPLP